MQSFQIIILVVATLAFARVSNVVIGTSVHPRPSYVRIDFTVKKPNKVAVEARDELMKSTFADLRFGRTPAYYAATLKLGSQGDENSVLVDTGSSDFWVIAHDLSCYEKSVDSPFFDGKSSQMAQIQGNVQPNQPLQGFELAKGDQTIAQASESLEKPSYKLVDPSSCKSFGTFRATDSESFLVNTSAPQFAISYADGDYSRGTWGTDIVNLNSTSIPGCSIAVVNETSSKHGVLGLGLPGLQATINGKSKREGYIYGNFPMHLKNAGVISKALYSLYLDSADSQEGSVLFGAVNHAKYTGMLRKLPVINVYSEFFEKPVRLDIALDEIRLDGTEHKYIMESTIAASLDSGSTSSHFPPTILEAFARSLNGEYRALGNGPGVYEVSCKYKTDPSVAIFRFAGTEIKVPISSFITDEDSNCYLDLIASTPDSLTGESYAVMGQDFLCHAYVVFDLDDCEVSLAQVRKSDYDDIQAVPENFPKAEQRIKRSSEKRQSTHSTMVKRSQGTIMNRPFACVAAATIFGFLIVI